MAERRVAKRNSKRTRKQDEPATYEDQEGQSSVAIQKKARNVAALEAAVCKSRFLIGNWVLKTESSNRGTGVSFRSSSGAAAQHQCSMRLFTIGHGTRSVDELVECLRAAGVRTLVDVRRFPGSRKHPQFGRDALAAAVHDAGIAYVHEERLGGRRTGGDRFDCIRVAAFRGYAEWMRSDAFQAALADALKLQAPCFLCAETLWWRCHRRLIAELLHAHGHEVVHLLRPGYSQPHRPWEPIAETHDGILYLCGERVA